MQDQGTTFPPLIEWGVASRPIAGELECGDLYVVKPFPNGVLAGAVDGLGHGPDAAIAARIAVATLESHAGEPVASLVTRCHERLKYTRGVAMTVASISAQDSTMTWVSVGNVEGLLLHHDTKTGSTHHYVVLRGGVVGEQLPPLHPSVVSVTPGDLLIFATDGISHGFADGLNVIDPPQEIADRILSTYGKSTDDALVLVVRYIGRAL